MSFFFKINLDKLPWSVPAFSSNSIFASTMIRYIALPTYTVVNCACLCFTMHFSVLMLYHDTVNFHKGPAPASLYCMYLHI